MHSKIALLLKRGTLLGGSCILLGHSAPAMAQDSELETRFSDTLTSISNVKAEISRREFLLTQQQGQIESLRDQITRVGPLKEGIRPFAKAVADAIEKEMNLDIPFRSVERFNRLADLRDDIGNVEVGESVIFRKAMNLMGAEVGYGNAIGSYSGNAPENPGSRFAACVENASSASCGLSDDQVKAMENGATIQDLENSILDGNYIHFGRLSLAYLSFDSRVGYVWNDETKGWEALPEKDVLNMRKAVRIARGDSAPGVVTGPVMISGSP